MMILTSELFQGASGQSDIHDRALGIFRFEMVSYFLKPDQSGRMLRENS